MNRKRGLQTRLAIATAILVVVSAQTVSAYDPLNYEDGGSDLAGRWLVGLSLGEIPILAESFKIGITGGYYITDKLYLGGTLQVPDSIRRGDESYNAREIDLEGLADSSERTGMRGLVAIRWTPVRYGPFVSAGVVLNGDDVETVQFDDRTRSIGGGTYTGPIEVEITRPAAVRPALGLGYAGVIADRVVLDVEWTFDWFTGIPSPEVRSTGADLVDSARGIIADDVSEYYESNFHNRYHIFHIGVSYLFE